MRKLTITVIGLTIFFLIAYDIVAVIHGGVPATLSYVIWDSSHKYPVIPFLAGGLCGHFFFRIE